MDLECCGLASIRLENASADHEVAVNIEPNTMVDIHPLQPHQAYAAVAAADAVEAEAEVDSDVGLEVGAGLEARAGLGAGVEAQTWAQAEPGPHYDLESGSRMRQGNISAASLKSARAEPGL
jgi:hypothetical protein